MFCVAQMGYANRAIRMRLFEQRLDGHTLNLIMFIVYQTAALMPLIVFLLFARIATKKYITELMAKQ